MAVATYDSSQVTVVVGGKIIVGLAPDSFLTLTRDEDMWQKVIGVDGVGTRAKTNNYAGTITVMLQHPSPSNAYLQSLATADELSNGGVVPVIVRDAAGSILASAASAWVKKTPDVEYAKAVGERTWVLDTDNLQMALGGNT